MELLQRLTYLGEKTRGMGEALLPSAVLPRGHDVYGVLNRVEGENI